MDPLKTALPGTSARGRRPPPGRRPGRPYGRWLGILILTAGCAPGDADQVVARVNGIPIAAQELELAIERKTPAGEAPRHLPEARQRLLQSLVIEELLAQQFRRTSPGSAKVDKAAATAVQRELLARHFAARLAAKVPPPGCEEIHAYYRDNPQLYARRQVFDLRRLEILSPAPGAEQALRVRLGAAASLEEVLDWLRKAGLRFVVSQTALGSNELPGDLAERLHKMEPHQVLLLPPEQGLQMIQLLGARSAPLDEASASPLIEGRLWRERQNAALEAEIDKLAGMAAISIAGEGPPPGPRRQRPPPPVAKSDGGRPADFPSCSAQRAAARRAGPNPPVEGLLQ